MVKTLRLLCDTEILIPWVRFYHAHFLLSFSFSSFLNFAFYANLIELICESLLTLDSNILNIERIQMLMQAIIDESELKAIKVRQNK